MFPLQSDGFVLEDSLFFEQDKFLEDLLADCGDRVEGNKVISDKGIKKRQKVEKTKDDSQSSNESKKIMHRDIERQRRQEMAGLYASLRSLLPLEYVKGKRSISDHMQQAVSYIKHMEKKIDEMQTKRDKLKKFSSSQRPEIHMYIADDPMSNTGGLCNSVKINPCRGGMEILITSSLNKEGFPLSKVLTLLVGGGFDVITCISTRVDAWFLHKIQIEVNNLRSINLIELQEKLVNVIKFA
ncbi:hypothetical protein CDL12_28307 [Handroanthus impetiginosus]|uniref:BHLH domain-containing protein n=1 Tax=Handroanthus impetiginosus TaxID=429701 RepID=A0A2G9G1L6_9LAMI|nr:hypothetical protein CDL12_28307 [Handroanthus impetiginosus]